MSAVDVVEFHMRSAELGVGEVITVTPFVNDVSLVELARVVELSPATERGEPDLAGAYAGLVVDEQQWRGWYLNDEPQSWFDDGDSCLLGCTCGDTGCWPLTAKVTMTAGQVTWAEFRTGHRPWDLHRLGPFRFSRAQYDAALTHPG